MHDHALEEFKIPQGYEYEAFVCHPTACFRQVAVLLRTDLVPQVAKVEVLTSGLLLRLRTAGVMLFLGSFHLPHSQREDCEQVWQDTQSELHSSMLRLRHQDHAKHANLDLSEPVYSVPASVGCYLSSESNVVELSQLAQTGLHPVWGTTS